MSSKFNIVKRLEQLAKSENIWVQYSAMAIKYNALNLGQGFPDYPPPSHVTEALASVATGNNCLLHQYTRGFGHPRLVNALSRLYSSELNLPVDPLRHILISGGAYVSLYSIIVSMVEEGDEVVILEPFFDCYEPMVRSAGGTPVFVAMRPDDSNDGLVRSANDWRWDESELRAAFSDRTKMLILNTPNNPTGKVFNQSELETLAKLCREFNVVCVSDEVYEWLIYPGSRHIRIASLPGMWQRTVTIGSAGKTFNVTGWKLGWTIGPEQLINNMRVVHRNCCYTCPTPTQEAIGAAMETELSRRESPDCFLTQLPKDLEPKRDRLAQLVTSAGLPVYMPAGGYFMLLDVTSLPDPPPCKAEEEEEGVSEEDEARDARLVKWLTRTHRLATIPCSCFYSLEHRQLGERYIRLCFIKEDDTIEKFGSRLVTALASDDASPVVK